jgi:hypothetical protein
MTEDDSEAVTMIVDSILADIEPDQALRIVHSAGYLLGLDAPIERTKRKPRKPSLIRAIRQARKAGVAKATVTVGDVSVTFGESDSAADDASKAWDEALTAKRRAADAKTH